MFKSTVLIPLALLLLSLSSQVVAEEGVQTPQPPVLGMGSVKIMSNGDIRNLVEEETSPDITGTTAVSESEYIRTIEQYQQAISQTEKTHGAYHDQLWEQLIGLSVAYQNAGHHIEAVSSLNQALHINRVNHGLHSLNQLPILDLLIKNNTALGDWEALNQNYHYLYWLNRRVYGEDDLRLLPVIDRVSMWHLKAYENGESENPFTHLITAQNMFGIAIHIIEKNYGPHDPRVITPLYGIMLTNYMMAVYASSVDDFDQLRSGNRSYNDSPGRCGPSSLLRRNPFFDECYGSRAQIWSEAEAGRQELISNSYRTGKKALTRALEVYENNPGLPVEDHARAYIHMGDWYMLFNRSSSAKTSYEQAFALLDDADSEVKEQLFGVPRSLPAMQFDLEEKSQPADNQKYVLVSMDITENGKARNIRILESNPPDDNTLKKQVHSSLKSTRFRPRYENGQPVPTIGVNLKYVFE